MKVIASFLLMVWAAAAFFAGYVFGLGNALSSVDQKVQEIQMRCGDER